MTTKRQKKKNKKKQLPKERNWIAVGAIQRKAGAHTDRKKERNKRACRGKVREQWKSIKSETSYGYTAKGGIDTLYW